MCPSSARTASSAIRCSHVPAMTQHRRSIHSTNFLSQAAEASTKASDKAEEASKVEEPAASAEEPEELTEEQKANAQIEELLSRNAELETEAAKWKDEMMRSLADAENTRKRAQREVEVAKKYGVQGFAKTMLDVSDNLGRAMESVNEEDKAVDSGLKGFYEGVELTNKILQGSFQKHGVVMFDPLNTEFDPNTMMALYEIPLGEGMQPGHVAQVVKTGFMLHDRVIRPAEVGVVKKA